MLLDLPPEFFWEEDDIFMPPGIFLCSRLPLVPQMEVSEEPEACAGDHNGLGYLLIASEVEGEWKMRSKPAINCL